MARSRVVPALFVLLCNLQCATSTTTTVTATADSTLRESSPSSTGNWGNVEAYGSPNTPKVGIFKFDLTSFLGTTVSQATLQLYADELSSGGGDRCGGGDATGDARGDARGGAGGGGASVGPQPLFVVTASSGGFSRLRL